MIELVINQASREFKHLSAEQLESPVKDNF
jgi:hypothetical protein